MQYTFIPENDADFQRGDIVPVTVHLPGDAAIQLKPTLAPLSSRRSVPFGRSTVVLAGAEISPGWFYVVKFSHIADNRAWQESLILERLHAGGSVGYTTTVVSSFAAQQRASEESLLNSTKSVQSAKLIVPRHLEVLIFRLSDERHPPREHPNGHDLS